MEFSISGPGGAPLLQTKIFSISFNFGRGGGGFWQNRILATFVSWRQPTDNARCVPVNVLKIVAKVQSDPLLDTSWMFSWIGLELSMMLCNSLFSPMLLSSSRNSFTFTKTFCTEIKLALLYHPPLYRSNSCIISIFGPKVRDLGLIVLNQ